MDVPANADHWQTLLPKLYEEVNERHFNGLLDAPLLRWNSRLRSSAGRFYPGSHKYPDQRQPLIEVASYLQEELNGLELVRDTLGHEMIHYWLWMRRRPYGHTAEFLAKMKLIGVSRYNPVPRVRPYKYLYRCPGCRGEFPARRRLGPLACARCCKGRYDSRFKLVLERELGCDSGFVKA